MSQQKLHIGLGEEVGTRNLEVPYATTSQLLTYILSIAVGINHKGCGRLRERTVQIVGKLYAVAHLLIIILATQNLQFVAHKHLIATLACIRQ